MLNDTNANANANANAEIVISPEMIAYGKALDAKAEAEAKAIAKANAEAKGSEAEAKAKAKDRANAKAEAEAARAAKAKAKAAKAKAARAAKAKAKAEAEAAKRDRQTVICTATEIAERAETIRVSARADTLSHGLIDLAIANACEEWALPILRNAETLHGRAIACYRSGGTARVYGADAKAIANAIDKVGAIVQIRDLTDAIAKGKAGEAKGNAEAKAKMRYISAQARIISATGAPLPTAEAKAIEGLNKAFDREAKAGKDHGATIGRARSLVARGLAEAGDFVFEI